MRTTGTAPDPERRRLFRNLLSGGDPEAPHQAPWHRVPEVSAGDGDVLWSGWASHDEVFVVGDEGMILHFDGTPTEDGSLWHHMETPIRLPLHALWGLDRSRLYAVGWMGNILRFDGSQWHLQRGGIIDERTERFAPCEENTPLFAITGDESGRAWAVGDDGMILALSPENETWQREKSGTTINLRGITRTPNGQLYAVGGEGTVLTSSGDGHWEQMECPFGSGFMTVLALGDDELLLAGGRYFIDQNGFRGELVRWREGRFEKVEVDKPMPRIRSLKTYKQGVLIVGDQGHLYYLKGSRLDQLQSNNRHDLMDIVPLPTGEALAVGDFGTIMTAAADFTQALAPVVDPNAEQAVDWELMDSGTKHQLWGLWASPDGTLHACGEGGTVLRCKDSSESNRWETLPAPSELSVHCLWDAGQGGLYAGCQMGQIFRFDGEQWSKHYDLHLDITILAMWGTGPNSIYAVGDEGLILHFDGLGWQRMSSGTKSALYNIWGMDDEHILAVGDFGLILRWNGENWAEFHAGTENFLYDVWGDSLSNIFIIGLSGTLGHFDGTRWMLTPARARDDLLAIDGTSDVGPYVVGTGGNILRYEAGQWQPENAGTTTGLRAVRISPQGDVFAAGDQGTILKRKSKRVS
ncbi:hypothetical protein [Halomonas sp. PR-M31]|uniref:WD40/YVTN/BNR-like repeat-containing protein n=1 Tax=Halomonas sp. PR-M31 TaxID=1471202 RepID=UPI000B308F19|nr:hypothetical protein [Halomonas sp. PR-M31]